MAPTAQGAGAEAGRPAGAGSRRAADGVRPAADRVRAAADGAIRPPIARTPLPALDRDTTDPETGASLPVHTRINGVIPPLEDDTYHRANLWGVTIEGAPFIDGGARGAAQNRLLTYLIDRYPRDWQARWLEAYAARGYRHFWTSIPDSRDRTRLSLAEYLDLTKRTLDAGLLPCHFLRSKDYDGKNPDPARVVPWVDALLEIGGIHTASHAWEASLMYDPSKLRKTIDHDARRWPQIRWGVHLQQAYADFGPDGKDHSVDFWKKNIAVGVKLLLYQVQDLAGIDSRKAGLAVVGRHDSGARQRYFGATDSWRAVGAAGNRRLGPVRSGRAAPVQQRDGRRRPPRGREHRRPEGVRDAVHAGPAAAARLRQRRAAPGRKADLRVRRKADGPRSAGPADRSTVAPTCRRWTETSRP